MSASDYSDNADIHNVNDFFEIIDININDVEYLAQNNSDDEFYEFALSGDFFDLDTSFYDKNAESYTLQDLPDLFVQDLQIDAGELTSPYPAGYPMYYSFLVGNLGKADANNVEIVVKLDGQVVTEPLSIGAVPAGRGGGIEFRAPGMSPGNHTMEVVVNPYKNITESNYNNNSTTNSFEYISTFELVAYDITTKDQRTEYEVGDTVTFVLSFGNSGLSEVKNIPIRLYGTFRTPDGEVFSGQMGVDNTIASIPPQTLRKAEVTLQFTRESTATIEFILDPDKTMHDLDYSNNSTQLTLNIVKAKEDDTKITIPVERFEQEKTNWCWATCVQMIGTYETGEKKSQADIVTSVHGRPDNLTGSATQQVEALQKYNSSAFASADYHSCKTLSEFNSYTLKFLKQEHPASISCLPADDGVGHSLTLIGVDKDTFQLHDPWMNTTQPTIVISKEVFFTDGFKCSALGDKVVKPIASVTY